MFDHVDARVDRHLGVDGLAVAGDLEPEQMRFLDSSAHLVGRKIARDLDDARAFLECLAHHAAPGVGTIDLRRSEEHTSELQSLMRISYAVFCLKKQTIASQQLAAVPYRATHLTPKPHQDIH